MCELIEVFEHDFTDMFLQNDSDFDNDSNNTESENLIEIPVKEK